MRPYHVTRILVAALLFTAVPDRSPEPAQARIVPGVYVAFQGDDVFRVDVREESGLLYSDWTDPETPTKVAYRGYFTREQTTDGRFVWTEVFDSAFAPRSPLIWMASTAEFGAFRGLDAWTLVPNER